MPTIVQGVDFDVIAREWRAKWSVDNDKTSLAKAQEVLNKVIPPARAPLRHALSARTVLMRARLAHQHLPALKALNGVKEVKRVVCGCCLDFKVVTAVDAGSFGAWEGAEFAPEKAFLEELGAIPGISQVETQTYTFMSM